MSLRPGIGRGRGELVDQIALRLAVLGGLARWMERRTDPAGVLFCPRHRVEHTGKNVYSALLHLLLWRYTREEDHLDVVKRVVLRTVAMLGEDPESRVPVFLPGRVDPRNGSTNAIDGGACADVLATVLAEVPSLFDDGERARVTEALTAHVEGYLRHAARERPITAQRLWAATGVARAARLLERDDWAADALAGCRLALDELLPDGTSPYIPEHTDHCTHPGLADLSTFYHSRTPGFVLDVHDVLGVALDERGRERVTAALDALLAMRDGNGVKVIHNEAKAWYWDSAYEVASHPFDVYALHVGARLLDRPDYAVAAGTAMEHWIAHLSKLDGGVDSHHGPGTNFQCRIFWTAHGAWAMRVLDDVALQAAPEEPRDLVLDTSGLARLVRPRYTLLARGRHRGFSNLFGCDVGGGAIQSLVVRSPGTGAQGEEWVRRQRFTRRRDASFLVRPAGGPGHPARWMSLLAAERGDLRFRVHLARVEWWARRPLAAVLEVWRQMLRRPWQDASPWYAAHTDQATEHAYDGTVLTFRGAVADGRGARLPGSRTERTLTLQDDGVVLRDVLSLEGIRGRVLYLLPERLGDVEVACAGGEPRRSGRRIDVAATGGTLELVITGRWSV